MLKFHEHMEVRSISRDVLPVWNDSLVFNLLTFEILLLLSVVPHMDKRTSYGRAHISVLCSRSGLSHHAKHAASFFRRLPSDILVAPNDCDSL